jgi:hypothetical protein
MGILVYIKGLEDRNRFGEPFRPKFVLTGDIRAGAASLLGLKSPKGAMVMEYFPGLTYSSCIQQNPHIEYK